MTAVLTRPAATLVTEAAHLKTLLKAVLAHAAEPDPDDFELPALLQLHIEVRDGDLRLICSDRFTMGIVRHSMTSTSPDFAAAFAVNAEDVRVALFSLKPGQVSLVVEENALRITTEDSVHNFPGENSVLPWRGVLDRKLTPKATPTERVALNPKLLARFEAALPLAKGETMLFHLGGENGVIIATAGTSFLGMIMPIHQERATRQGQISERPLDAWFDLADEEPIELLKNRA